MQLTYRMAQRLYGGLKAIDASEAKLGDTTRLNIAINISRLESVLIPYETVLKKKQHELQSLHKPSDADIAKFEGEVADLQERAVSIRLKRLSLKDLDLAKNKDVIKAAALSDISPAVTDWAAATADEDDDLAFVDEALADR